MQTLPVDSLLPKIVESLHHHPNLVIEAAPGAGKTTRVPRALLNTDFIGDGEVWVLEPRRLAARMAAERVAKERGERLGQIIGYQVRFSDVSGPQTRLRFLTEGIFTRRALSDPNISKAKVVILDEFHERNLQTDLALALVRRLQQTTREDLRIVVMSATLDTGPISRFLGDCPVLSSEGRMFDVTIEHQKHHDNNPLEVQVADALKRLLNDGLEGDVLVFLPGAAEIRRSLEACEPLAQKHDLLPLPLHGELSSSEQDRAIHQAEKRKVILSTNVAETSVTIDGIVAVIDSGLARLAGHSHWTGLPTIQVSRISKASAKQRAGRAGRTRAGRCLRLYTTQDFAARANFETPEIERLDLTQPVLELHAAGVRNLENFEWFVSPPAAAIEAAETLLRSLGALDQRGRITQTGQDMLRLPLPPRMARVVVQAEKHNLAREASLITALISERDIRQTQILLDQKERKSFTANKIGSSDLLELYDLFIEAERTSFNPERLRRLNLDIHAVQSVNRVCEQLSRVFTKGKNARQTSELTHEQEEKLLVSLLAGFPDRVAQRRITSDVRNENIELFLANGETVQLAQTSVVRQSKFLVAIDIEQRKESGRTSARGSNKTLVRLASAIEPEWILDLFADSINETQETFWNPTVQRVEIVGRMMYGQIVLDESRKPAEASETTTKVLADAALNTGLEFFVERELFENFLARVQFLVQTLPEEAFPVLTEDDVQSSLIALCEGRRSFAELKDAVKAGWLMETLFERLTDKQRQLLGQMAPERVKLKSGRQVRVHYEQNSPPWIESRLQDFFGMTESPKIAAGRVSLVVRLLAPSNRPVQVTTDLAGFWQRNYPQIRRELSRRYPRHKWPEDPLLSV
jgi:ATP-dependent helicase HrpB